MSSHKEQVAFPDRKEYEYIDSIFWMPQTKDFDMPTLQELCSYLDDYLQLGMYRDISQNGLQVQGAEQVDHIALAVDARQETFRQAAEQGAQMLIVHHGIFWGRVELVTGHVYERMRLLIENKLALYAAHLPLDAHMEVGNNVQLAKALGLQELEPWAEYKKQVIGIRGVLPQETPINTLKERLQQELSSVDGTVQHFGKGKENVRTVGIVTGDAANELMSAAKDGVDVLITGEPSHVFVPFADELQTHLLCGGHYATETYGVKALGAHLEDTFGVKTTFLHVPTFA
ncbi:MAG: Nif3-like dinuclear metal center hexameric protein [Deltaproteobacteria bacterium]|nr:Nif3-like dinuclear metal center hexameric protein [Deltaproteobacteria bacterium]MBU47885.1 Nif3-like dinuclear metal center hexameric protein [Deltaproteobacteria bacterium]|tara:strand:+ start:4118 stop:4978 length:861 start_codon:yes stop_codon:yes gene_type:complete